MGGVRCGKKVIDNYAIFGAEAAAIAATAWDGFLVEEATALFEAAKGSCEAYYYIDEDINGDPAKVQVALDESYRACDHAKELRRERDAWRAWSKPGKKLNKAKTSLIESDTRKFKTYEAWALDLRAKRDEMTGVFQKLAEDELTTQGFKVPE